ncbi:MAG: hypothetical protein IJO60_01565 [Agathobacter sp.]|nr:hypothetical protein [Agathobacter sp.]
MTEQERAEIEAIYDDICENQPMVFKAEAQNLIGKLHKLFDEYEAEIVVDAFCWGYYYGRASK